jgi:PKD repeat protein
MKNYASRVAILLSFFIQFYGYGQLPNGSIAPDFTATDLNGNTVNLYSILNSGKTVFMDISATWCGPCWSYHQTHALKDLYNQYGPPGTNELTVLFVEGDASTTLADLNGTGSNTTGNWVAGTPYPILDNAAIANQYAISYYPTVYMICPNKTIKEVGTKTKDQLYAEKQSCPSGTLTAAFSASTTAPCLNSTVTFTDNSGSATSWAWSFSPNTVTYVNGTSATSQNPQVQFTAAGNYTVSLTATNANGSDDEVKTNYITPNTTVWNLPVTQNFEGTTFPPAGWVVENSDAPSSTWGTAGAKGLVRRPAAGNTGSASGCVGLNCFNYSDTSKVDNLISSTINLSGTSSPKLSFKRAYKYYNSTSNPNNYHDELRVYVSTNCGVTYGAPLYFKKGGNLATNGTSNSTFTPAAAADWKTDTIDLSAYVGQNILVKFEFQNRYGNNLYIDDINIQSSAALVASCAITSNDSDNTICSGTSVTFTATPTNGGTSPTYQWKINGVNVGTNSPTFTTSSLTNGQSVSCSMTSNLSGVTPGAVNSNAISMTVNTTPSTPTMSSNSPVCSGSSLNLTSNSVSGAAYAWTGPNGFTSTLQNPVISNTGSNATGTYNLTITSNGCSSPSSTTSVTVNQSVTPTNSIGITMGGNPTCTGQALTYTATVAHPGTTPNYQWTINGSNVGTNSPTFSTSSINNNDVVACTLTSNATCATTTTVASTPITMSVTSTVTPALTISAGNTPSCSGSPINFTSAPVNGGTAPSYQWTVNGVNASTAANFTSSSLNSGDVVACTMISNSGCASPSNASSNTVTVNITPTVTPSIQIAAANTTSICEGSSITINSTPTNGGSSPSYNWLINGVSTGITGNSLTTSNVNNNDVISCVLTSNQACVTTPTSNSNPITITVNPLPTVSLVSNSPVCEGENLTINGTVSSGASFAMSGPNGFSSTTANTIINAVSTSASGTYSVSVQSNGCSSTSTIDAVVLPAPSTPTIAQNGHVMVSSSSTGNQWYMNGNIITGATSQSYTALVNGAYTVVVTQGNCSSTVSNSAIVNDMGISTNELNSNEIKLYPNPNTGTFNLEVNLPSNDEINYIIYDIVGKIVQSGKYKNEGTNFVRTISLPNTSKGEYILQISYGNLVQTKRVTVF